MFFHKHFHEIAADFLVIGRSPKPWNRFQNLGTNRNTSQSDMDGTYFQTSDLLQLTCSKISHGFPFEQLRRAVCPKAKSRC